MRKRRARVREGCSSVRLRGYEPTSTPPKTSSTVLPMAVATWEATARLEGDD